MKYKVDPYLFEKIPNIYIGVIVGKGLINSLTRDDDTNILAASEDAVKTKFKFHNLKTHPAIDVYRRALKTLGINPNKYPNSVEAMSKRVLTSNSLPRINALVDLCNAISLRESISLGAHDLQDIQADLEVRFSTSGDKFMPFAKATFESLPEGELVFVSGKEVQTRQWLWRQSEVGKITLKSQHIFFHLVGFKGANDQNLDRTMAAIQDLITDRFKGQYEAFILDREHPQITF